MKEGIVIRKILICFGLLICIIIPFKTVNSSTNNAVVSRTGSFIYSTVDTKATSGIRWKTVGFTITRVACTEGKNNNGGYPKKMQHATLFLQDSWKDEIDLGTNIYVTFTIPKEEVSKALVKAGFSDIKNNDIIYLHGIFQVLHNGKPYGSKKYDLPSITKAESWANPDDFKDRFDIRVSYKAPPEPISIQYKTSGGDVIGTELYTPDKWKKPGENISVSLQDEQIFHSKKYKLYKSYIRYYGLQTPIKDMGRSTLRGDSYQNVKNRNISQRVGGVQFVAIMKEVKEKKIEQAELVERELDEPEPYGIIAADKKGNEKFQVTEGIPSSEDLYIQLKTQQYLFAYQLKNVVGKKTFPVTVKKQYRLEWEEKGGEGVVPSTHSTYETKEYTYSIERTYSYWKIEKIQYYKIKEGVVENQSLPSHKQIIYPVNYHIPKLSYELYSTEEHVKDFPYEKVITAPQGYISGSDSRPSIPNENLESYASSKLGQLKVKNDKLIFHDFTILSANVCNEKTDVPKQYSEKTPIVEDGVLFAEQITIPAEIKNGEYESTGYVVYEPEVCIGEEKSIIHAPLEEINEVRVHTPVVCHGRISDAKQFNQLLEPSLTRASVVLDRFFSVDVETEGMHLDIKGYGYQDYECYTKEKRIRIPFDVYQGDKYIPAQEWIDMDGTETFYVPIWVEEGNYTIDCQVFSINAEEECQEEEEIANLDFEHYVATDEIDVQVSGRIYGMTLYDISDYPLWEPVFRYPFSLKRTGVNFSVGLKNQNGQNKVHSKIVPTINGSHPMDSTKGIQKLGYVTRFSLTTIGEMHGEKDFVQLKPRFYYVDRNGKNRKEVDVYYTETIKGYKQVLVKVGSQLDLENIKYVQLCNPYVQVDKQELLEKMDLTGKSFTELFGNFEPMYTFHHILLSNKFRTYVGKNYFPGFAYPAQVNIILARKSMQKWYGEYYLPSEIHLVDKDFDLKGYEENYGSFRFDEPIWIKNGYLIVNFDIVTVHNEKRYLSYVNEDNYLRGYCNMWKTEGFVYSRKDTFGTSFQFEDGDYIIYDLNQSAARDYQAAGTH